MKDIRQIINEALEKVKNADVATLESIKVEYLGKSGVLTQVLKSLSSYSIEDKKRIGSEANNAKSVIESEIENKRENLKKSLLD
ncbi:MAG: hypothetical protein LBK92_02735, partial [Endomicrobium sp.]|nr:hypothetical protein [Endomicrobium sp.]